MTQEEAPTATNLIKVPHTELSPEALRGVIESFVLREGTDYGDQEFSLDEKVQAVMRQLARGEAHIVFDSKEGSCDVRIPSA